MHLQITREKNQSGQDQVNKWLYEYNLARFPKDLGGRYEEVSLFVKDAQNEVHGGLLGEICWNWLEIHVLILDEEIRQSGYGSKLMKEAEKIARAKNCDFIKVDTLSFQAREFYEKLGYEVFGTLKNVGREHEHYYLKKDLTLS
ncbi:GNAT family N-acetyltransferase [Jeotgalibacillus proteolyticus]|uniref:GNAT family N-acetyltransferase n=1 Tax=Jeotgalibacillus proteolyticus TaxID=2082395 RepID=UPI003CF6B997